MANALPDALGGIGYANVFQGSPAIEDWREDLKYAKVRKLKDDEEKKKIAAKPTVFDLKGWEARDQAELTELYGSLQKEALALKSKGVDPFSDPDFSTKVEKAKILGAAADDAKQRYAKAIDLLKTQGHKMEPDERERYIKEVEQYASAGGKAGQAGGMYARTLMTEPEPPAFKKEFYPDWQKMKKGVLYNVQQNWNPAKSAHEQNKRVLDETIDAEWSTYQLTDAYEEQLKRKMKKGLDADAADAEMKQELVDALPPQYKEMYKFGPEYMSGGGSEAGYKPILLESGDKSEAVVGIRGATKEQQDAYQQQVADYDKKSKSLLVKLGWKESPDVPLAPTGEDIRIASKKKLLLTGVRGKEPQMLSFKVSDIEGNEIDKFRPYEIRKTPKGYIVTGRGQYTEKGVSKEADSAIELVDGFNLEDFEKIYLRGSEYETLDEWWGGEQPTLEIDVEKKTVKPASKTEPNDYVTSILNFEQSKGYDNFGFTSEPKGSIKTIEQAKTKFNKEYLPLIKDLPIPLQAVAGDFAFNSEDPRASLMVAAGYITPEEKKKLYVNGKLDKAKVDKLWNAGGDGGLGRVGNEYAGDPEGFLDAFDKERIRSYENTNGADQHLAEWKERVKISRQTANKLLSNKTGTQKFVVNGKTYNIPADQVAEFKKDMGLE